MPVSAVCPGCGKRPHLEAGVFCDVVTPLDDMPPYDGDPKKFDPIRWHSLRDMLEDAKDPYGNLAKDELTRARIAAQVVLTELALLEQATEIMAHEAADTEALVLDPAVKEAADRLHHQVQESRSEWLQMIEKLMNDQFMPAGVKFINHVANVVAYSHAEERMDNERSQKVAGVKQETTRQLHMDRDYRRCAVCEAEEDVA